MVCCFRLRGSIDIDRGRVGRWVTYLTTTRSRIRFPALPPPAHTLSRVRVCAAVRPAERSYFLAAAASALVVVTIFYLFHEGGTFIGIPFASIASEHYLARVGVVGVTVVSTLAGFGSINYPYKNISAFLKPVTHEQVSTIDTLLLCTVARVAEKNIRLSELM
eukprot:GHVU01130564.1.p1 GENE.GHVU01130564.1~~GHVU01130564.1.p1  ORF type:complete len:163 (-),score=3.15 GHVU01130564.1:180-668(-)